MSQKKSNLNDVLKVYLDDITSMIKSLSNTYRISILGLLSQSRQTFQGLQEAINLSKTATAHHLSVLLGTRMVNHMSRGNYEISHDGQVFLDAIIETFLHTQTVREEEILRKSDYILRSHKKRSENMTEIQVRIVELEPMQVASVRAISTSPENDAWNKMREWAKPRGLLEDLDKHPVFGFNNPNPSKDKPDYGYEFWIKLDPDVDYGPSGKDIEFKKFNGGKFAVATSKLKEDIDSDGVLKTWKYLTKWAESSDYDTDWDVQCLEKALSPDASEDDLILDLYLPIKNK